MTMLNGPRSGRNRPSSNRVEARRFVARVVGGLWWRDIRHLPRLVWGREDRPPRFGIARFQRRWDTCVTGRCDAPPRLLCRRLTPRFGLRHEWWKLVGPRSLRWLVWWRVSGLRAPWHPW